MSAKIFLLIILLKVFTLANSEPEEKKDDRNIITKLREDLLLNSNYDKMARPVIDSSKNLIVGIKYLAIRSLDLDISSGTLSTNLIMFITWTDEHLTWNQSNYDGLEQIFMDTNDIWMPTLQAWNSIYSSSYLGDVQIGTNHPFVKVNSNGTVQFEPKPFITTKCSVDLSNYPQDKQTCVIFLGSFSEQVPEVNITLKEDFFCDFNSSIYTCNIRETKVYNKKGYPPFFKIFIDLQRKKAVYFYIIDLPYYSAILLTLSTLLLPFNNQKHFKLKLTTISFALFIIFTSFSLIFIEIGFRSIKTPYIVKCVTINLVFNSLYLILICTLNQFIINANRQLPNFLIYSLQKIPFLNNSNKLSNDLIFHMKKNENYDSDWVILASFLDKILIVTFITLLFVYHA